MSRVLIVSDDPEFRQRTIAMLLPQYQAMMPEGVGSSSALLRMQQLKPAVVIVRADLQHGSGLDLATNIMRLYKTVVIVVAMSDSSATRAFEVGVADYLIAPIRPERLALAMQRALSSDLVKLASARPDDSAHTPKLRVKSRTGFLFLEYDELMWVEAEGNYCTLHCVGLEHRVREILSNFLARVEPHGFMRVHRSIIVNTSWIRELRSGGSGNYVLVLQNSVQLPVSRPYQKAVDLWVNHGVSLSDHNPDNPSCALNEDSQQ